MKILLWKIGALGDVVMTTPLLRQLRHAVPESAEIDFLTGKACVKVLEGNVHIHRVIGFDEDILFKGKFARIATILQYLRGYDAIFVLDKHWIFSLLAWMSRAPMRIGFSRRTWEGALHTHRVPYGPLRHEIHYYLDLAQAFGISVDRSDVALDLPTSIPFPVPHPYVVLINSGGANPGERSEVRKLPVALFGALVEAFLNRTTVVFLGTQAESDYYAQFAGSRTVNLCGRTNLPQAWSVLRDAQAVYATDSGLMHMAGAVNARLTAMFGPTHPSRKCPPKARWAWSDQAIYDSAYEMFGKVPAGDYFRNMRLADILDNSNDPLL